MTIKPLAEIPESARDYELCGTWPHCCLCNKVMENDEPYCPITGISDLMRLRVEIPVCEKCNAARELHPDVLNPIVYEAMRNLSVVAFEAYRRFSSIAGSGTLQ
jgi:hypothetical protein